MYEWVGEKYACVDLNGVLWAGDLGFYCGMTYLKVISSKIVKHEKVYSNNKHVFIAFDTYAFLTPERDNETFTESPKIHA